MISVCIATYNGEKYIRQQLDSILLQTKTVDEIIISDDSSTDRTVDIIKSYNDSRINLIENQSFNSPIFNLENAIKHSKGYYVFLADQDDIWNINKVEVMLKHLQNYHLVISDCNIINDKNETIHPSAFKIYNSRKGLIKNIIKNSYIGCCIAFKKELLDYILPFPKRISMHDLWIGLIAELFFSVYFCDEQLMLYRRHSKNNTPLTNFDNNNSLFYKVSYRVTNVFILLFYYIKKSFK